MGVSLRFCCKGAAVDQIFASILGFPGPHHWRWAERELFSLHESQLPAQLWDPEVDGARRHPRGLVCRLRHSCRYRLLFCRQPSFFLKRKSNLKTCLESFFYLPRLKHPPSFLPVLNSPSSPSRAAPNKIFLKLFCLTKLWGFSQATLVDWPKHHHLPLRSNLPRMSGSLKSQAAPKCPPWPWTLSPVVFSCLQDLSGLRYHQLLKLICSLPLWEDQLKQP